MKIETRRAEEIRETERKEIIKKVKKEKQKKKMKMKVGKGLRRTRKKKKVEEKR